MAVPVSMGVSIALTDETIHAALEPGTPTPRARLELVRAIVQAGLPCQVLVAPILPMITDSDEQIDARCSHRSPPREPPARPCSRCICVPVLASGSCATSADTTRS